LINVPYLSYEQLKAEAERLLQSSSYVACFPVAIELIVEFEYQLEIIPIPGLQKAFDIDAFISADGKSISVDEFVLENRLNRYRFSLAHELGHRVLHGNILQKLEFDTIEQWKIKVTQIPEREYGFLEYQANTFANCLLVPAPQLETRFDEAVEKIRSAGLSPEQYPDECLDYISTDLGRQFEVSKNVIQNRLLHKNENFQTRLK